MLDTGKKNVKKIVDRREDERESIDLTLRSSYSLAGLTHPLSPVEVSPAPVRACCVYCIPICLIFSLLPPF